MSPIKLILPGERLSLDPESSGFAHGFGLFETLRVRQGRLQLWEAHWRRLIGSARQLGMECPDDQDGALAAIKLLAQKLPAEAIIKMSLLKEGQSSRLVIYSRALSPPPESVGLQLESSGRINENSVLTGHKTHNYLENLLALEAARKVGCLDALRLNSRGQVAEGAISNIFFYRDGCLHTPHLDSGALPGVVRGVVLDSFPVQQEIYTRQDLLWADGVFLTNASFGIVPVDWMWSEGAVVRLQSGEHPGYREVKCQLSEHLRSSAIKI